MGVSGSLNKHENRDSVYNRYSFCESFGNMLHTLMVALAFFNGIIEAFAMGKLYFLSKAL